MVHNHSCGWACTCWYVLGVIIWIAALIALVYAWVATIHGAVLGQRSNFWFASAMTLGVLAIPLKLRKGNCGCESCERGVCKK